MAIKKIISVNAVGGITKLMNPNSIVVPDQIIDYTYNRKHTFYDEDKNQLIDIHDNEVEPVKINRKIPGKKIKSIEVLVKVQNN